jgi:hypothetical protein
VTGPGAVQAQPEDTAFTWRAANEDKFAAHAFGEALSACFGACQQACQHSV